MKKKKNKIRVPGVTNSFLWLARLRGHRDAKRGAILPGKEGWTGPYLEEKAAAYNTCIHKLYGGLEAELHPLEEESARLLTELALLQENTPGETAGALQGMSSRQLREAARQAHKAASNKARTKEILERISVIEETVIHVRGNAAALAREAKARTARNIQAYLYGAAKALGMTETAGPLVIREFFDEAEYTIALHRKTDGNRAAVIETLRGAVESYEHL